MITTKRLVLVLALLSVPLTTAGCLLVRDRRGGPVVVGSPGPGPGCHPSEYWDGYNCRRRGRGHDFGDHHGHGHDHHDHDDHGWHRGR